VRALWFFSALGAPVAALSCATGAAPFLVGSEEEQWDSGDVASEGDAGNVRNDGSSAYVSEAGTRPDAARRNDAGANDAAVPDSAKDATAVETGGGGINDLCQGQYSQQVKDIFGPYSYDDACDAWWYGGGPSKPCASSGTSCAAFNGTDGYGPYCCYVPPQGSYCRQDYNGVPQCLPK